MQRPKNYINDNKPLTLSISLYKKTKNLNKRFKLISEIYKLNKLEYYAIMQYELCFFALETFHSFLPLTRLNTHQQLAAFVYIMMSYLVASLQTMCKYLSCQDITWLWNSS